MKMLWVQLASKVSDLLTTKFIIQVNRCIGNMRRMQFIFFFSFCDIFMVGGDLLVLLNIQVSFKKNLKFKRLKIAH